MFRRTEKPEPLPEDSEDLVMVEDELNSAADHLRTAAKRLLETRDRE